MRSSFLRSVFRVRVVTLLVGDQSPLRPMSVAVERQDGQVPIPIAPVTRGTPQLMRSLGQTTNRDDDALAVGQACGSNMVWCEAPRSGWPPAWPAVGGAPIVGANLGATRCTRSAIWPVGRQVVS